MEFTKAAASVNVGNADTVVHLPLARDCLRCVTEGKNRFENRNFLCYLFNSKYSDMPLERKVDYCYQCTDQRMVTSNTTK
ncbi:hypothetical protein T12_12072 [Trichinella patagoniensis]|uniref:Uncharacterized protein n=1 Tax=Trichinella patagoniensis TaxID=990121 RepID=A0A0V0ZT55_9BILA|nr:hypothetical protein T12_12072 [Trichinella patagoniensis]